MSNPVEISRTNPTCVIFLVDQSHSMEKTFGGQPGKKKSEGVADAINRLLQNLVLKCAKSDGVRDYFHVGIFGYGGAGVKSGLGGKLTGQDLAPISALANNPLRVEQRKRQVDDGAGGLVEQSVRFPIWFEPAATGKTPMCAAVDKARETVEGFLKQFPNCYPPMVLNLTDGKPTDGNPLANAQALCGAASNIGNVTLFNAHLSSKPSPPILFPSDEDGLPDNFAKLLFRISSMLPPHLREAAKSEGYNVDEMSRGFVFNGDLVAVIRFLEIGTRVATNLR
jgi:hypothetical protein